MQYIQKHRDWEKINKRERGKREALERRWIWEERDNERERERKIKKERKKEREGERVGGEVGDRDERNMK